ncbi:N-acyl-D-amino-acid deacylase family protein [Mesorhizobium shangrilense]|uniref:D-aminoacylase n=1 Tax=Mesorhizobium shangrilense TaxID=460060 RepID=A0ABV2DTC2_9HYPH
MIENNGSFDILFHRALIIDGTGTAGRIGDVAFAGDRIAAVGDLAGARARQDIDADGLVLAPGFIDVHTHDDALAIGGSAMEPKVTQGVTTVVTGNCGISLAPLVLHRSPPAPLDLLGGQESYRYARFADYLAELDARPPAVNVAPMVGHTTLRVATMDTLDRPARPAEIKAMSRLLEESLEAGAIGFSTGLYYPLARAAPTEEVIELLAVVSRLRAVYTTHMRDEEEGVEESLRESFDAAMRANVPLIISHHKCMGIENHGRSVSTLKLIDQARATQTVGLDAYPYVAGSTVLMGAMVKKSSRVLITWSKPHPEIRGEDLSDIARKWDCSIEDAIERLVPAGAIYFHMSEEDVRRILGHPATMIGSDGLPHDQHPHPRLWGTFPRVLGHYARDLQLFSLEEAVRKMTGLPATTFKLRDRGLIAPGGYADVVLFDATTIADTATFDVPIQQAAGIKAVFVNGRAAVLDGKVEPGRSGRVLRRVA